MLSRIVFFLLLLVCICSCTDDDILTDAASQPSYVLNSGSSQHLGTLFPGRTTSTQKLMLYNHNDGALKLESIRVRGGEESLFRINVDGMAGTVFDDPDYLRIARGDSLFVLLEACFMGEQQERDVQHEDFLDIQCNGQLSSIRLTVNTHLVEELHADTIRQDTLWAEGSVDKLIYGTLFVSEGVTLAIEKGLTLYMHDKAYIDVRGTLKIDGTYEEPVRIIGDRTDSIFSNLAYEDMSAQWMGIHFGHTSQANVIDHAQIKGMTLGITLQQDTLSATDIAALTTPAVTVPDGSPSGIAPYTPQLTIRNTLIKNSDHDLVQATSTTMVIENSCLMNSGGSLLSLSGGAYDITHCTLANYQFWTAWHAQDVMLSNWCFNDSADYIPAPLYRCNFTNTLIHGNSGYKPNVYLDFCNTIDGIAVTDSIFCYRFDHCLIDADGEDDDDFIATLWGEDPMYTLVDMPNYICNPVPLPESPVVGRGNPDVVSRLPYDLNGKPRPTPPAIGCYEP